MPGEIEIADDHQSLDTEAHVCRQQTERSSPLQKDAVHNARRATRWIINFIKFVEKKVHSSKFYPMFLSWEPNTFHFSSQIEIKQVINHEHLTPCICPLCTGFVHHPVYCVGNMWGWEIFTWSPHSFDDHLEIEIIIGSSINSYFIFLWNIKKHYSNQVLSPYLSLSRSI